MSLFNNKKIYISSVIKIGFEDSNIITINRIKDNKEYTAYYYFDGKIFYCISYNRDLDHFYIERNDDKNQKDMTFLKDIDEKNNELKENSP